MITVTISGPPKSGKSMIAMVLSQVLDVIGVRVLMEDEGQPLAAHLGGIGTLLRKMFRATAVTIRTRVG